MFVLGVDIGLYHMGLVMCEYNYSYELKQVIFCELVDITNYNCNELVCPLYHEKCIADYMSHFFKNYSVYFDKANYVIIERQPPMGLIAIQELIMFNYRSKSILISPNSMHAHYDINHLDYEGRKIRVVKMTEHFLSKFNNFNKLSRKHDISDALCITRYWLFKKNKEYVELKIIKDWKLKKNHSFIKKLSEYTYIN